jgi:recombination protein RecT
MSDAVAILEAATPLKVISNSIYKMKRSLQDSLPADIRVDYFISTALLTIQGHKDLGKILGPKTNRQTLYLALRHAASDGLMIDGRQAAIVPFNNNRTSPPSIDVVYIPMYQGLLKLARHSGEIKDVVAEVVYEKDGFHYTPGHGDGPVHEVDWFSDRGKPRGVYCMIRTRDGGVYVSTLSAREVLNIARRAKNNYYQYNPETGPCWPEWWKKTAVRRNLKYAPRGRGDRQERLDSAIEHDNEVLDMDYLQPLDPSLDAPVELEAIEAEPDGAPEDQVKRIKAAVGQIEPGEGDGSGENKT